MLESIRRAARFVFWLDERECLQTDAVPVALVDISAAGCEGGIGYADADDQDRDPDYPSISADFQRFIMKPSNSWRS